MKLRRNRLGDMCSKEVLVWEVELLKRRVIEVPPHSGLEGLRVISSAFRTAAGRRSISRRAVSREPWPFAVHRHCGEHARGGRSPGRACERR